jgi:hypothetical protein
MKMQPDGLYHFSTEMPGDESVIGWGADPMPHIHYDVICNGCAANPAFAGGRYHWWSKFYPEGLCTLAACGKPSEVHQATKHTVGSQTVYKYDFIFPEGKAR